MLTVLYADMIWQSDSSESNPVTLVEMRYFPQSERLLKTDQPDEHILLVSLTSGGDHFPATI